ncbi:MAG TPA: DUF1573 domain-containing protein [Candidatus Polarisedimenticolaceae bacterium]|nr:DUF1573 domain-containing protein [Candidatus Polarisedimenticolaceae bacterium]
MNARVRGIVVCLAALAVVGSIRAAEDAAHGRLQVESDLVDIGDVVRGQPATATFVLKNVGSAPLKVLDAKPGCGCTVASFDDTVLPARTGKVTATVKTENFHGPIEKQVTLTTDDPLAPSTLLRIKANVVGSVAFMPRSQFVFPAGFDWSYAGKLLVRKDETESGELRVAEVTTSAPWLIASARRVDSAQPVAEPLPAAMAGDYILEVRVGEDVTDAPGPQTVTFHTGLPREPVVTVPVSVSFRSPLRLQYAQLLLRPGAAGDKQRTASLTATMRPGLAKEQLKATAMPEPFAVKLERDGERNYTATVTWQPTGDAAPKDGSVVFEVAGQTVTLPVHVAEATATAAPAPGTR